MKKILVLMLIIWVLSFTTMYSIDKKQMEKWVTIITEKDAPTKMQKLEEFHTEYGDKNDQLTRLIYMNLTITSYQVQKFDKTIEYGEKALESKEIENSDKLKIYLSLANAYYVTKTDMGKGQQLRQSGHRIGQVASGSDQDDATGAAVHRSGSAPCRRKSSIPTEKA